MERETRVRIVRAPIPKELVRQKYTQSAQQHAKGKGITPRQCCA